MRINPKEISLDIMDRRTVYNALLAYQTSEAKAIKRCTSEAAIEHHEGEWAKATDMLARPFFDDVRGAV